MILVTGATGFLGSHLTRALLSHGQQVRALYRFENSIPLDLKDKAEWVCCDILDVPALEEAMQGVEQVYHCAAKVSFNRKDRQRLYEINVTGTANVVNTALYVGVRKLLHVSSIASLGRKHEHELITEDTYWEESDNNSYYAVTKYQSEMEVWRAMEEGLNAVIVNPSVIIGEGDWNSGTCRFFKTLRNGLSFYPVGMNGFVSVHDVVQCSICLMQSDITNERFILNGENLFYKDFFTYVTQTLEVKSPRYRLSPAFTSVARRISDLTSFLLRTPPFLTKETANTVNHIYQYSNEKIKKAIGYEFEPANVFVCRTAQAYKDYLRRHS